MISCLYGGVRGYRRWAVRREVQAAPRFSHAQITALSRKLFEHRVHESTRRFPEYAQHVKKHRGSLPVQGESFLPEELPVWTRRDQRVFFKVQQKPPDAAYIHQTSGSTGTPVNFYVTRESYEWRTAVSDRGYSWAGAEEGRKSFYLWAADQKVPPVSARIKRRVHSALQRRTYFDVFRRMGDEEKAQCCRIINKTRPAAIVGYTSMLIALARYARDNPGALRWKARTLVNAAEGLQSGQRELLETYLVDEVYLAYGSREFMLLGMECDRHNGYHVASDNVLVEIVDDTGRPVPPGERGRVVITDFHNAATPFIRYEIGDLGTMAPQDELCPCGLPFPLITNVDGRLQDVIHTPDGGVVTGLYVTFTMRQFGWIEGYQVVQNERDRIVVKLLSSVELTPELTSPVSELLRKKLGAGMRIDYERVDELIRRESGKVHLVMSSLND